jgi:hypothetical protein
VSICAIQSASSVKTPAGSSSGGLAGGFARSAARLYFFHFLFIVAALAFAEIADGFAHRAEYLGQLAGAKDYEDDDKDEN